MSSGSRSKWVPATNLSIHCIRLNILLSLAKASVKGHVMYPSMVADPGMQIGSGIEGGDIARPYLSEVIRNTIMPCLLIINHS